MTHIKKIFLIAGARPNFMKVAPLYRVLKQASDSFDPVFVHTGQHYDNNMSHSFLHDLELPEPHVALNIGSASHAVQTAKIMMAFEQAVLEHRPDLVVVVGDVNSTIACALVASKLQIPVAHIEAGLRSYDREMPEEINRVLTDQISDLLFTTCEDGNINLRKEGIAGSRIHFIGNLMIESLIRFKSKIDASNVLDQMELESRGYVLMTLHRPSNVDDAETLQAMISTIETSVNGLKIVFPVHPRTQHIIEQNKIRIPPKMVLAEPIPYYAFMNLQQHARFVLTDSGGVQEETTFFRTPCLTLRENTERPITISQGSNVLVGTKTKHIELAIDDVLSGRTVKPYDMPQYWDDQVSRRFLEVVEQTI